MVEVVAEVELVEGEGHFEGGFRGRLAWLGAEEGYDMVWSVIWFSLLEVYSRVGVKSSRWFCAIATHRYSFLPPTGNGASFTTRSTALDTASEAVLAAIV